MICPSCGTDNGPAPAFAPNAARRCTREPHLDKMNIITGGFGCLCTVPLSIIAYVLSLTQLSKYMNARPHLFR